MSATHIRITQIPPGFAPLEIRRAWLGVEIPLATQEQLAENPLSGRGIGNDNAGGYTVRCVDTIAALQKRGASEAVRFWESLALGHYLVVRKECCEEIGAH